MNLLHRTVVVVCGPGRQAFRTGYLTTIGHRPPQVGIRQHARLQIRNGHQPSARGEGRAGRAGARCGEVARQKTLAGRPIRINPTSALRQPLLESFVVSEHEHLVLLDGTSDGSPELVPFEWTLFVLEVVLRIEGAVTVIFEEVAMPLVRSGRGYNADLPSGPFSILGAIGVFEDVIFPHGLDAQ